MCLRKIFGGGQNNNPVVGDKILISFAINDYPGSANDLSGCIHDQENAEKTLLKYWSDFKVKKFKDREVTKFNFKEQIKSQIALLKPGTPVVLLMDCCFAEDNTKDFRQLCIGNRCYIPKKPFKFNSKALKSVPIRWVAFSASQDNQTSADAYISGAYNGAFTYFAMKSLNPEMTYIQWYEKTRDALDAAGFEQIPALQEPEEMLNGKVFDGDCLVIHYSGHGTTAYDPDHDDADNQAEAVYLYDGMVLDDELNDILSLIP